MIDPDVLLQRRTLCGLSQRKLAKLAGVHSMTIKRLEDRCDGGDLPLRVLGRLADALHIEPRDLLQRRSATAPQVPPPPALALDNEPLDHNAAKLLRRIHRGEDVRRTMTRAEREIILPSLVRRGAVTMTSKGCALGDSVARSLALPDTLVDTDAHASAQPNVGERSGSSR